jgi:hypothetical protein
VVLDISGGEGGKVLSPEPIASTSLKNRFKVWDIVVLDNHISYCDEGDQGELQTD